MFIAGWGAVRSVRFMMFAAGTCAFFLSLVMHTIAVGVGYAIYMGYVAMVQTPLNTLLMNQVREDEQAGASMMSSLFSFMAVAAGGFVGGRLIDLLGYAPMLALSGAACMSAAVLFVILVKKHDEPGSLVPRAG
jgi:predicted MFS family arabinose efflux permease